MKINTVDKNLNDYNILYNQDLDLKDIIIINNISDLYSLHNLWRRLYEKQHNKSIFNNYYWIKSNWAWHEKQGVPTVVCFYQNHELIGLIPLVITIVNNKTILKFLDNPLTQYCDFLLHPLYIDEVISNLFKLLDAWGNHWDILDLSGISEHSLLYKKLCYFKSKDIPFKLKITNFKKISYIKINSTTHNWQEWLNSQAKANSKSFNKLEKHYGKDIQIQPLEHDFENNKVVMSSHLINLIDDLSASSKLKQPEKLIVINNFLKRLCHYNNENNWLKSFDCYKKNSILGSQYLIIDNKNLYYLPTLEIKELSNNLKKYLYSLIIKNCIKHDINKIYFTQKLYPWQKLWPTEYENIYKIQIFNK